MIRRCDCAMLLSMLAACGGASPGLDLHFATRASSWNDVVQRVTHAPSQPAEPALLLSIDRNEPPSLIAHDGTQRELWHDETTADAVIHIAGASVLTVESGSLVVRDAATGERDFVHALSGMSLLGAARDGDAIAWIAAVPSITVTQPRSTIVVADARTGNIRWQRTIDAALGAPVLRGGILIAPWNRQGLTAIDARNGHELARLDADAISVDWVESTAEGVVYGSNDVHDIACADANSPCAGLKSPFVDAPSHPTLHRSGYRAPEPSGIRTVFSVTRAPDGRLHYADDRAYLIFYRYIFAFDTGGSLAWVRMLVPEILNARPFSGGIALLDADGRLTRLRASDGASLTQSESMGTWRSAESSGPIAALSESERVAEIASESLRHALLSIALDPDNRLVVARAYAAQVLARDPDPEVTQQLLDAYEQRSTPSGLRHVIAQALISRRSGSEQLVAALQRHHDFLAEVTPAPLSVVVPALIAMEARRAVPALIEHLRDPATSAEDLLVIAAALERLADRTVADSLIDWLRSYRASTALAGRPDVVIAVAHAARSLSETDAPALDTVARAEGTQPVIAGAIDEALRTNDTATSPTAQTPDDITEHTAQPIAGGGLDQRKINALFADRIDALRACIVPELARNPTLAQIRIAFVARPDGSVHGFAFAPSGAAFASCVHPITDGLALSPFNGEPTVASYVIQLRAPARPAAATDEPTDAPVAEWWSWYARELPPTDGAPWWSRYVEHDLDWLPMEVAVPNTPAAPNAPILGPGQEPEPATPTVTTPTPPATPAPAAVDSWWLPAQP